MTSKEGKWFSWNSTVEIGIGLAGPDIFFYFGSLALYTLTHLLKINLRYLLVIMVKNLICLPEFN